MKYPLSRDRREEAGEIPAREKNSMACRRSAAQPLPVAIFVETDYDILPGLYDGSFDEEIFTAQPLPHTLFVEIGIFESEQSVFGSSLVEEGGDIHTAKPSIYLFAPYGALFEIYELILHFTLSQISQGFGHTATAGDTVDFQHIVSLDGMKRDYTTILEGGDDREVSLSTRIFS
jgi:hypothetical protein